jgi:hypothetical protein
MSRALLRIDGPVTRARAMRLMERVPEGTRVEFKGARRTLPQNDKMWALLSEVARQKTHCGRRYTADNWKSIFMHAMGRETVFVPSLDCETFFPLGWRSADLSKAEMSELIEFIQSWGVVNGVVFADDTWEAHEPG